MNAECKNYFENNDLVTFDTTVGRVFCANEFGFSVLWPDVIGTYAWTDNLTKRLKKVD